MGIASVFRCESVQRTVCKKQHVMKTMEESMSTETKPFFQLPCGRIAGFTVAVLAIAAGLLSVGVAGSHASVVNLGACLLGAVGFIYTVGMAGYEKPSVVPYILLLAPFLGGCYYAGMTFLAGQGPIIGGIFFALAAFMLFKIIPRKIAE